MSASLGAGPENASIGAYGVGSDHHRAHTSIRRFTTFSTGHIQLITLIRPADCWCTIFTLSTYAACPVLAVPGHHIRRSANRQTSPHPLSNSVLHSYCSNDWRGFEARIRTRSSRQVEPPDLADVSLSRCGRGARRRQLPSKPSRRSLEQLGVVHIDCTRYLRASSSEKARLAPALLVYRPLRLRQVEPSDPMQTAGSDVRIHPNDRVPASCKTIAKAASRTHVKVGLTACLFGLPRVGRLPVEHDYKC
jgi:hypothetical protein